MTPACRIARFSGVSALGIGVQLTAVTGLIEITDLHYGIATTCGVTAAIVHNFLWHARWTWGDRRAVGRLPIASTFGRFTVANGLVSLAGNLAVTTVLVSGASMTVPAANLVAIAVCGLVNFWLSDRFVFRHLAPAGQPAGRL